MACRLPLLEFEIESLCCLLPTLLFPSHHPPNNRMQPITIPIMFKLILSQFQMLLIVPLPVPATSPAKNPISQCNLVRPGINPVLVDARILHAHLLALANLSRYI